jgi:hypothetical protein
MNKWEREVFLPKLAKRNMTEKAYGKIARAYDFKKHDVTRVALNEIHDTVSTLAKIDSLVKNTEVSLTIQCPSKRKMSTAWSRGAFLTELKSGPMSDTRFDKIMKTTKSDYARKFRDEWNIQREVANSIWDTVDCGKYKKAKAESATAV